MLICLQGKYIYIGDKGSVSPLAFVKIYPGFASNAIKLSFLVYFSGFKIE